MSVTFAGDHVWQIYVAAAFIAAAVTTIALFALAVWRAGGPLTLPLGGRLRTQSAVVLLTAATALLLSLALAGPGLVRRDAPGRFHVVLLIDASESVLREPGGWPTVRDGIARRLRAWYSGRDNVTAEVVTFRSFAVSAGSNGTLASATKQIASMNEDAFGAGAGTDIAAGLSRAGAAIDRAGGRGAILLFSDGHQTDGDAEAAATQLAHRGIAVHVVPLAGGPPEVGIVSVNLPPYVEAGGETFIRGVLNNASKAAVTPSLELARPLLEDAEATRASVDLAAGAWARFRVATAFESPGLQYVDVSLRQNPEGFAHRRRLFTNVERPPRILAIGDDRWTHAFPPGAIIAVRREPGSLRADETFDDVDAFVIDGVPATAIAEEALASVAATVRTRGAGLFVANGRHDRSPRDATNLMTYNGTALEPLLPLITRPRPAEAEPPPRHVVMVIDSSGSMCGGRLEQAQGIAQYLVEQVLRPVDVLDLLTFTIGAAEHLMGVAMTAGGRAKAIHEIRSIGCGGPTQPKVVLQVLASRAISNCALLFFSDGEFDTLSGPRPDCRTTVFGINASGFPDGSPIRVLADPIHVPPGFDPRRIRIPSFEPRPVDQFFETGMYPPLSMKLVLPNAAAFTIPPVDLDGSAITVLKPEADLIAVRPKLADPVLAYGRAGAGVVGAFTSAVPAAWLAREDAREAIRQWISATFPLIDARRYHFQVTQSGSEIQIEIALSPIDGRLPLVDHLSAHVDLPGAGITPIPLRADDVAPATFRGRFTIPARSEAATGSLVLQESGRDAIARPQRIPIVMPSREPVEGQRRAESFSAGVNEPLLRAMAGGAGGTYDDPAAAGESAAGVPPAREPLWPPLIVAACVTMLAAVFLRRVDP